MKSAVHRDLGLTDEEYRAVEARLGRAPTYTELAMFSVMWSEHCSYKSSRVHLATLPAEGPHVVVGPGEGAGVVEVAAGVRVAWKMESHNHPSFVEPVNGAATGVGGIVRDVLSMGARPIALLDSLRFGLPTDARSRYLVDGVVGGISSYGNSIGVPTVGGEASFDECYSENPLVNVACLGVVETLMHGRADTPGFKAVLIGSSTGRDGIGGASVLASAEFGDDSADKRPSVQVGDPFAEKLLIEACLELIRRDLVAGIQDLGAGGISCPSCEMTAKAGTGVRVDLARLHRREPGMEPFEVAISESQERMLAIVAPEAVDEVLGVCARWELDASVVGEVTATGRVEFLDSGQVVADVPARALAAEAPVYTRPAARPAWLDALRQAGCGDGAPDDLREALVRVLSSPNVASKRWIWEQYDHMIFLGTLAGPGGDAAVVRLLDTDVAVALACDGPARLCYLDPYEGARLAVCEAARNVACTGARPLAVTNCLNFGNPEKPEVMWQFAEAVRGLGDACRVLQTPVVGGNVSFYNETRGRPIRPTPVVGMLGVLPSPEHAVGLGFAGDGHAVVVVGSTDPADFAGSEYAAVVNGTVAGVPPAAHPRRERALCGFLHGAARRRLLSSAHDCSEGGLAIALLESAVAGGCGVSADTSRAPLTGATEEPHRVLFAETPGRVVLSCAPDALQQVLDASAEAGLAAAVIGTTGGDVVDMGAVALPLSEASTIYDRALPALLSATMA